MSKYSKALNLVGSKIRDLRTQVPIKGFDKNKPAEVEINKFYFQGDDVDRIMIVLRAAGCEHYKLTGGCSMCSHINGTNPNDKISDENYFNQWNSILDGSCFEKPIENFSLNNYPVVCLYNLGSLLNGNEISLNTVKYIFTSLNEYKNVKKVIIESRAEYINEKTLGVIRECYDGLIEVGIGVESTNKKIRELCHYKGLKDIKTVEKSVELLHNNDCSPLAYVNFKPVFLTEQESIDDAIKTSIDCDEMGFNAISIEPTSLQEYSLANHLNKIGYYRTPWLWSLPGIVKGIYAGTKKQRIDIRLGGYFDEEILSGSQGEGFAERNEIFPHETSSNCQKCTSQFIEKIKKFNMTYDVNDLNVNKCDTCYPQWEDARKVKDSRSIEQRIFDVLGRDSHE